MQYKGIVSPSTYLLDREAEAAGLGEPRRELRRAHLRGDTRASACLWYTKYSVLNMRTQVPSRRARQRLRRP